MPAYKKIVSLCIAVLLMIIACTFLVGSVRLAGQGNKENIKINSLSEFGDVLYSYGKSEGTSAGYSANGYGKFLDGYESSDEYARYDSYTLIENAVLSSRNHYDSSSQGANSYSYSYSSAVDLIRKLEMYKAENGVWYKSEGTLASRSSYSYSSVETREESFLEFNVQIIIRQDCIMINFDHIRYTGTSVYRDSKNPDKDKTTTEKDTDVGRILEKLKCYSNVWIDCSSVPEIAEMFLYADQMNSDALSGLGRIVKRDNGEENFKRNEKRYSMKEDSLKELLKISDGELKASCVINLENSENPKLDLKYNYIRPESGNSANIYAEACMEFKNIGNTVLYDVAVNSIDIKDLDIGE